MKAIHANDQIRAAEIMMTSDPGKMKVLGDHVKIPDSWNEEKIVCMEKGLDEKLRQNPDVLNKLLETGHKNIAEASVNDIFWGIGKGVRSRNLEDVSTWTGRNELGKLLMKIRDRQGDD